MRSTPSSPPPGYNFRRLLAWLEFLLFAFLFAIARAATSQNQRIAV
jgi:hypothetical protein